MYFLKVEAHLELLFYVCQGKTHLKFVKKLQIIVQKLNFYHAHQFTLLNNIF